MPVAILSSRVVSNVGEPTPQNMGSKYMVGATLFDNENGKGATSNNAEIAYMGFQVFMRHYSFKELALRGSDAPERAVSIVEAMKQGVGFGTPFLSFKWNEEEWKAGKPLRVAIWGHEGRARSIAFNHLNPTDLLPVHMLGMGGSRARHFSPEFFTALRERGMVSENLKGSATAPPAPIKLGKIFWMGKIL